MEKKPLLRSLVATLWEKGARWRHHLYDAGYLKSVHLGLPTLSIGNIELGGTGKTPLLLHILKELEGQKMALLTRGYRSIAEKKGRIFCGEQGLPTPLEVGDEALVVAKAFPSLWIGVGADRFLMGHRLLNRPIKGLILEDGFQHRKLLRDEDIILVDGKDPLGGKAFFPKGRCRDLPERLQKASLIVALEREGFTLDPEFIEKSLAPYTKAPLVIFKLIQKPCKMPKKVAIYTSIAKAWRLPLALAPFGLQVVLMKSLRDHSLFKKSKLDLFAKSAENLGAEAIVMTPKDQVKCPFTLSLPIITLETELLATYGKQDFDNFLTRFKERLS